MKAVAAATRLRPVGANDGLPGLYGETSMSRKFAELYSDDYRYVPEWGQWLAWDGARWRPDVEGLARVAD